MPSANREKYDSDRFLDHSYDMRWRNSVPKKQLFSTSNFERDTGYVL